VSETIYDTLQTCGFNDYSRLFTAAGLPDETCVTIINMLTVRS